MIALDSVLPDLERAVTDRVESKVLAGMDAGDLRDLIYKLVERQRSVSIDPHSHFAELVAIASERHADFVDAKEHNKVVRTSLLKEVRKILGPALPALLGPIHVETTHVYAESDTHVCHPILRGFQLIDGMKKTPAGTRIAFSGRSWWLVGIPGEESTEAVTARYALGTHWGQIGESGDGTSGMDLQLVTAGDAATQIRDGQFTKMIMLCRQRLVDLAGPKVSKKTDAIWNAANALDAGLAKMKSMSTSNEPKDKTG